MTKVLKCGSVVPGCEYVAHGDTEADVLQKIAEHARAAHEVGRVSDDLQAKLRANIRDERVHRE